MPENMRAITLGAFGAPEVLRLSEGVPRPLVGEGDLLLRVHASGVNRPDVLQRLGRYAPPAGAGEILGLEVAGEIVSGDSAQLQAAGFSIGDRVCALVAGGGYAEYCAAPISQCLPIPENFTFAQAAALPETFFTVWTNVFDRAGLQSGETLLIQGGSSGIGVAAIQLAKAFGAQVMVTAGSAAKCQACLELGADFAVNYKEQDFSAEALRWTEGRGVDVILDMVAGDYVARELGCLAEDGRVAIIAVQGGVNAQIDAGLLLRRRLTVTGSTLRPRSVAFKAKIASALRQQVWPLLESRIIRPVIFQEFLAEQAAQAHALMESNQHVGKLVLVWS